MLLLRSHSSIQSPVIIYSPPHISQISWRGFVHPHMMILGTARALRRRLSFPLPFSNGSGAHMSSKWRCLLVPLPPGGTPTQVCLMSTQMLKSCINSMIHRSSTGHMSSTTGVRGTSASLPREADSQEEGGSRRHDSFRRRARDAPIDPRLYQHLERLGLGCEGRTRHKKLRRQEKRKKLSEEELLRIEKQVTREAIPYFQQVRSSYWEGGPQGTSAH